MPIDRQRDFLRSLEKALVPGARICLLDNRYVDGSSTPVSETDADGNTYQVRHLEDGSTFRALKNFPSESHLRALVASVSGVSVTHHRWQYFWAVEYRSRA